MLSASPRSATYERLEGGMGPGRPRKLAWKKIAIGCGVLMGLVWFFGPRGDVADLSMSGLDDVYPPPGDVLVEPTSAPTDEDPNPSESPPTNPTPAPATAPVTPLPTSPETDPNPLGTTRCATAHDDGPLVQYALMIDAGSTGSRVHVYKFNRCDARGFGYEWEAFRMTQPGLSDRGWTPTEAAASLDGLLGEGMKVVPEGARGCTPVVVKATAGLRLRGAEASARILEAVRDRLGGYPFSVPEGGVGIMDGREEGVYAWMTANYLMGAGEGGTYAVLDLGGGSTQIVFEPEGTALREGEHRYEVGFRGRERVLYQHSYLGYGLKSARERVHRVVEFLDGLRTTRGEGEVRRVANPCLAQETEKEVAVLLGDGHKVKVWMAGEDVGSFEACSRVMELVMAKDAACEVKPCSFDGVHQPALADAFPAGEVLLLSYFYDRIIPLIPPVPEGVQPRVTVATIATLARQVCAGPSSWSEHWGERPEVMEELTGRPEWCLDLTFMRTLLGLGYGFDETREVALGKRIEGTELGWCLGATIALLEGGVGCRA